MKNLTRQIVVRVDEELYQALQQDAERYGRTVAQSVRFYLAGRQPSNAIPRSETPERD